LPRTVAWAGDTSRLLGKVASEANLALALINVVRNKGARVSTDKTVEEAEAAAPKLLLLLRRALLEGCYRPAEIRRVLIPKPGDGQPGRGQLALAPSTAPKRDFEAPLEQGHRAKV
jgi:RNA-directed DNA polymerase